MSRLPPWTGGRLGIVMMSALGDAVHVLPLLDALKRHAPATHVTWVLQPGPAVMVQGHPLVDDVVIFQRALGLRAYGDVRRRLRVRPFDVLLNLQVYFKAGIVTRLARAPVKLGFDVARARDLNWLFTTHRIPPHAQQHVQDNLPSSWYTRSTYDTNVNRPIRTNRAKATAKVMPASGISSIWTYRKACRNLFGLTERVQSM